MSAYRVVMRHRNRRELCDWSAVDGHETAASDATGLLMFLAASRPELRMPHPVVSLSIEPIGVRP